MRKRKEKGLSVKMRLSSRYSRYFVLDRTNLSDILCRTQICILYIKCLIDLTSSPNFSSSHLLTKSNLIFLFCSCQLYSDTLRDILRCYQKQFFTMAKLNNFNPTPVVRKSYRRCFEFLVVHS